jgi:hypothetical protein
MDRTSTPGRTATPSSIASRRHDDTGSNVISSQGSSPTLLSSSSEDNDGHSERPLWFLCWNLLSWCFAIITYVAEGFVVVWVAVHYATFELYVSMSLTLVCYFGAVVINGAISLFWYYDLDRVSVRQLEASGPFPGTYKRKCSFSAIVGHCLLLGEVYRYGELIARQIISGQTASLRVLHRDATLLRFFHAFVATAPQILIHLYTVTVATDSSHPDHAAFSIVSMNVLLPVLGVCVVSFLYSLMSFVTSDRLSSKSRRVILPAHLALLGFYLCIVVSRIAALTLFAHASGYFVILFLGVHWVLSVFGVLNQKSQFCLDYAVRPRRERWWLEVPFSLYAACLYQFIFFSVKEGKTRYTISVYLVVTFIENVLMVVLFFTEYSSLWYAPAAVAMVIGLFLLGTLLLLVYYVVLHPDRTGDWYWVGIPKKCCEIGRRKSKSYRPHNVEISSPTLVNMNGQATNVATQTRLSGLQPLTSILSRNKTTGQMQLSAPPVIDSGIPSREDEYYKKPRVCAPQQRSSGHISSSGEQLQSEVASSHHQSRGSSPHYQIPSNRPVLSTTVDSGVGSSHVSTPRTAGFDSHNPMSPFAHTQIPSSFHYPPPATTGSSNPRDAHESIRVLQIPGAPSLGSSVRTDSEDLDPGDSLVPESVPTFESYDVPSLQMESQLGSALHATLNMDALAVSNPGILNNVNASNANHSSNHHDIDIDSPVVSPYDTLETARQEVVQLRDTEAILEENEISGDFEDNEEEGRFSASPPNLPTPDFTDHALLPGDPLLSAQQEHRLRNSQVRDDGANDIHHQLHEMQHEVQRSPPVPPRLPTNPQHPLPPSSGNNKITLSNFTPHQSSNPTVLTAGRKISAPQGAPLSSPSLSASGQLQMFQGIPAKRDYKSQTQSQLERHYFPEPSSHSTPNIPRGPIITGDPGGQSSGGSGSSLRSQNQLGKSPVVTSVPHSSPIKSEKSPGRLQSGSGGHAPERTRGRTRGGRGRGGGGNGNRNGKKKSNSQQQSYYAYDSSSKPPTKQNPSRTPSLRAPVVSPENRQLFGRALPPQAIGGQVKSSPWQQLHQQRSTAAAGAAATTAMPLRVTNATTSVPPPPVRKPSRSPDRTKVVQFQTGGTPVRPRSYSEGTSLESGVSQDRPARNSQPSSQPQQVQQQPIGPQYSPHYLGRSPGAPRKDLNSYYAPNDRTQVLNLTWTSPRLHHDPAVSGEPLNNHQNHQQPQQQRMKKMSYDNHYGHSVGVGGQSSNHAPILKQRSQTAYELGYHGNAVHQQQRKVSNPLQVGGVGGHHHSSRPLTNQNAGANPLLHVPSQSSHTSRV